MYKMNIEITMDHDDLDAEEFFALINMKLDRLKENFNSLDFIISGGTINDEIGFCNYQIKESEQSSNPSFMFDAPQQSQVPKIEGLGNAEIIPFDRTMEQ